MATEPVPVTELIADIERQWTFSIVSGPPQGLRDSTPEMDANFSQPGVLAPTQ